MSRTDRSQRHEAKLHKTGRYNKEDRLSLIARVIKRVNKTAGYGNYPFEWHCDTVTVVAYTRSEARSLIKKELGISKGQRLPVGIVIKKGKEVREASSCEISK